MEKIIIHTGSKAERVIIANKIIAKIAGLGRKFFCHNNSYVDYFLLKGKAEKVYMHNQYNGMDLLVDFEYGAIKNFSHGGTLQGLVKDFAYYIRTGEYANHKHGYGGLYCPHWGYSETEMKEIQDYARELDYLNDSRP